MPSRMVRLQVSMSCRCWSTAGGLWTPSHHHQRSKKKRIVLGLPSVVARRGWVTCLDPLSQTQTHTHTHTHLSHFYHLYTHTLTNLSVYIHLFTDTPIQVNICTLYTDTIVHFYIFTRYIHTPVHSHTNTFKHIHLPHMYTFIMIRICKNALLHSCTPIHLIHFKLFTVHSYTPKH